MAWLLLLFAGLFEVVWSFSMKLSEGFTRPVPTIVTIVAMIVSFAFLSAALKAIPLGTAYTVWTGIGAVGAFTLGILVLGEPATVARLGAVGLIVAGLTILRLAS